MATAVFLPVPFLWSQVFTDAGVVGVGYQIFIYQAGTTVPITTFTDSTLTNQNPNPFQVSSNGRLVNSSGGTVEFWVPSGTLAKIFLTDSTNAPSPGVPVPGGQFDNISGINDVTLTAATIGAALYPVTTAEGTTVVNIGQPYGNIIRYGGSGDAGVTDNTLAFQNALNSGYPVTIPLGSSGYYKMSGRVVCATAGTSVTLAPGAIVQWSQTTTTGSNWLGTASRPGLEVQADNFSMSGRGFWVGPSVASFVQNEIGLMRVGPSASNRGSGFIVTDVEFYNWGYSAIGLQYMQNTDIELTHIRNCGYGGVFHLSCLTSKVNRNRVHDITPGLSGNAYGIEFTHDSTNYNTDPNVTGGTPRQAVNPFCIDFEASFNTVYNIPLWIAIDAHGAYEGRFTNNAVYNCFRGLQIASSSGNAINYAGENNRIESNSVYSSQTNGTATTVITGYQAGITVNGGSTVNHTSVWVTNNTLVGMGHASLTPSVYCIEASLCESAVIEGNILKACVGRGIYMTSSNNISIKGNVFDSVGASAVGSNCIYLDSNTGIVCVEGNIHNPVSGTLTAYTNGLNTPGSGYSRMVIGSNDFEQATNPYANITGTLFKGLSDRAPLLTDTTTGSHTLSLSAMGSAPVLYISWGGASNATITDITGSKDGQLVVATNTTSNTLTINDTGGHIKLSGGTQNLAANGVICFLSVAGVLCQLGATTTNS